MSYFEEVIEPEIYGGTSTYSCSCGKGENVLPKFHKNDCPVYQESELEGESNERS